MKGGRQTRSDYVEDDSILSLSSHTINADLPRLHKLYRELQAFYSLQNRKFRSLANYRFVICCAALTSLVVFLINLIFIIWATTTFPVNDGVGTMQRGSCAETKRLNFWIHFAINVLSTALLGASNYTMQCLSSPTRRDIEVAHMQRRWLDIGIPSLRNVRQLSKRIVFFWLSLALSSVPLHLFYNSTIFATLSTQRYTAVMVSQDFMSGSPFRVAESTVFPVPSGEAFASAESIVSNILLDYQLNSTSWTRIENEQCVSVYTSTVVSRYSHVILVTEYENRQNSFIMAHLDIDTLMLPNPSGAHGWRSQWLCYMTMPWNTKSCGHLHPGTHPWTIDFTTWKAINNSIFLPGE